MSVRRNSVRVGLVIAAITGLGAGAIAPAGALDAGPSTSPKLGTDLISVGSDTTQWVMDALATSYDADVTTGPRMVNYDACVGNTTPGAPGLGDNPDGSGFPCGADNTGTKPGTPRPESVITGNPSDTQGMANGSGAGRTLLQTPSDPLFPDVAFSRSSSAISIANLNAGEIPLPFAVDKFVSVVSPTGPAPVALSGPQLLKIFNGTFTNWDQVGGKNAEIHPYLPKTTSGTYNSSLVFLAALDGVVEAPGSDNDPTSHAAAHLTWQGPGVAITDANWNTGTVNVEEHDPSIIQADPDAIELFSYGRAQLTKGSVRIEGGWSEDREQYNVVRGKPIAGATYTPFIWGDSNAASPANGAGKPVSDPGSILESVLGNKGYICTNADATADINKLGDWPLNSSTCGVPNNSTLDTINPYKAYGVGEGAATETSAFVSNGAVNVAVTADDGSTPTGSVTVVASAPTVIGQSSSAAGFSTTVPLNGSGQAVVKLPAGVSGKQVIDVSYLPTNFGAQNSAGGHTPLGASATELTTTVTSGPAKFQNLGKPVLSGKHKVGSTETSSHGQWAPGATSYSYQWYKGSTKISGATKSSLKLTKSLKGKSIHCTVTAKRSGYPNASASSKGVKVS